MRSKTGPATRAVTALPKVYNLRAIKAGQPDQALALMQSVQATCTPADNAVMAHRIAASYRAEGRDADAYRLAMSVSDPSGIRNLIAKPAKLERSNPLSPGDHYGITRHRASSVPVHALSEGAA